MRIVNFHLNHLRNDAHFQYQSDFRDSVIKGGGAEQLKIKPQFDEWLALFGKEELEGIANYETFINRLNAVIAKYAVRRHHHKTSEPGLTGLSEE